MKWLNWCIDKLRTCDFHLFISTNFQWAIRTWSLHLYKHSCCFEKIIWLTESFQEELCVNKNKRWIGLGNIPKIYTYTHARTHVDISNFICNNQNFKRLCQNCFLSSQIWNLSNLYTDTLKMASLMAKSVKNPPAMQEMWVRSLGWEALLEKEMAANSSILAWEIPWTEEPGGLQSISLKGVRYNLVTKPPTTSNMESLFLLLNLSWFQNNRREALSSPCQVRCWDQKWDCVGGSGDYKGPVWGPAWWSWG